MRCSTYRALVTPVEAKVPTIIPLKVYNKFQFYTDPPVSFSSFFLLKLFQYEVDFCNCRSCGCGHSTRSGTLSILQVHRRGGYGYGRVCLCTRKHKYQLPCKYMRPEIDVPRSLYNIPAIKGYGRYLHRYSVQYWWAYIWKLHFYCDCGGWFNGWLRGGHS